MNISALDENGKPVDWWFLYKVPKLTQDAKIATATASASASATGYEYVYFDPNAKEVTRSPHLLTDGKGALDLTLNSVFSKPAATTGWILYNDEMPASAHRTDSGSLGHTKGVIAFDTDTKTAFWLLHSWPKYADPGAAGMPTPMYGQTFICITLDMGTASKIATQMAGNQQPQVYEPRMPSSLSKTDPLYLLTKPLDPNAGGESGSVNYVSKGKMKFTVIAKNRDWGKDFWNQLVGPELGEDMDVETWIRGKIPPTLDSDGIHKTFDIKYIDLSRLGAPWAWPETHDHAKWGITKANNWICVGDINRMISQEKRGGGTIAFQNEVLWTALSKTDLLVAPPGHSRADARKLIKATHTPAASAPAGGKSPAKASAALARPKTTTKKKQPAKKKAAKKK
jgi:deoxyribonuclease II